jgi:ABC-type branched-subunit amino acid transport system substrate-binding protein
MLVAFIIGALFGAIVVAQVAPNLTTTSAIGNGPGAEPTGPGVFNPTISPTGVGTGPGANPTGFNPSQQGGAACAAGRNGGATDTGITATEIKLATTVVRSGVGAAFLGDVQFAMEAVRNKVNRAGGICGRQLSIKYVDDGWRRDLGAQFLRSFIQAGYFAIPVGPSSEGLNGVIEAGDIRRAKIPVVGTDGMTITQYEDPWVWPVAVATASSARIMVSNAVKRGAKKFAIVFDNDYRFGVEAAAAFNKEVKRLTGENVTGYNTQNRCEAGFCGVESNQPSYRNEVNEVGQQDFDFLAMFLEPQTANTWMATPGAPTISNRGLAPGMIGLAQPLFTRDFANGCQQNCHQMWVWTGYKPPIEGYADDAAVRTFVSDLRRTKPDADESNAFAEGGYVGMQLLIEGLRLVGPNLTRERLRQALDSLRFTSGLTLQPTLTWPAAPRRYSSSTMQAFEIQYLSAFGGWRSKDIVVDPRPMAGIG